MSELNVAAVGTINLKNNGVAVTTAALDLIPAIPANSVAAIDSIYVTNITGTLGSDEVVTVQVIKAVGPITIRLAYQVNVPKCSAYQVETKDVDLMEGDKIQILGGSNSKLEAFASWKVMGP